MDICTYCNNGFSADEEYLFMFLNCVLEGTTVPDRQDDPKGGRALRRHNKRRARIERSRTEYQTDDGETRLVWAPEEDRVNRVILKNARGHAFYEYGESMLREPDLVRVTPFDSLTAARRNAFEDIQGDMMLAGWPEVGSRVMTRVMTGQDLCDVWVIVQDGVYRYGVAQSGGILVRSVLFEYLATEVYWIDP